MSALRTYSYGALWTRFRMTHLCLSTHWMGSVRSWPWRAESYFLSSYLRWVHQTTMIHNQINEWTDKPRKRGRVGSSREDQQCFRRKRDVFLRAVLCCFSFSSSLHLLTLVRWPYCLQSQVMPSPAIWIGFYRPCLKPFRIALEQSMKKKLVHHQSQNAYVFFPSLVVTI